VAALATIVDLQQRVAIDLNDGTVKARAVALLDDASAAVRAAAGGQVISSVANDSVKIVPQCGIVRLPQIPVTAVDSVVDKDAAALDFTWYQVDGGGTEITLTSAEVYRFDYEYPWRTPLAPVTVVYDHGYDPVPDDIVALVCQVAARALGRPPETSGLTQETIGAYSYSIGVAAAAGGLGLLDSEKVIARRYANPVRPARQIRVG
jgi:hypothetical protein